MRSRPRREKAGFTDVETYINTGNVRLTTSMRSRAKVEAALEEAFLEDRGFEVPTIVFTPAELSAIAADAAEFAADHEGRHYVSLLKDEPSAAAVKKIEEARAEGEVGEGERSGSAPPARRELPRGRAHQRRRREDLGVATNRNLTVIRTVAEKWA